MSETLPQLDSQLAIQAHSPEAMYTGAIEAEPILDAFIGLHATAFGLHGLDAADVSAQYIKERPTKGSYKNVMTLGAQATAGLTSSIYLYSVVPGLATVAGAGVQQYRRHSVNRKALAEIQKTDGQRLIDAANAVGESLGGLELLAWRDATERQIILQVPSGTCKADNIEIVRRLSYLENVLASKGKDTLLGGYILSPQIAEDAELEDYAIASLQQVLRTMGKKSKTGVSYEFYTYVDRIIKDDTAPSTTIDVQRAIELIRLQEPNHPVVTAADKGASKKTLQVLAQQALQERLSEARKFPSEHAQAGAKYRTSVMVQPGIITTTLHDGRCFVLPASQLALPASTSELQAMSTEQVMTAAEYTVYIQSSKDPDVDVGALQTTTLDQDTIHTRTDRFGSLGVVTRRSNGKKVVAEQIYTPSLELTKKRKGLLLAGVCLATLGLVKSCEVNSYVSANNKDEVTILLGTNQAEVDTAKPAREYLTSLEEAPIRLLATLIGEHAPPSPDKMQTFKDLVAQLGAEGFMDEVSPFQGLFTPKNGPEWYINAPEGVDITGYWGVNRYEAFAKPADKTSYSWLNKYTPAMQELLRADDGVTLEEKTDFAPPKHPLAGQQTIEVTGAISLHSSTVQDGLTWMVVNVPVLHQREVVAVEASIVGIDVDAQDIKALHKDLPVRKITDNSGTVLFIAIPKNVDASSSYISLRYNVSVTPTGLPIQAEKDPKDAIQYDKNSGQYEASKQISSASSYATISHLDYEIGPVDGDDTNGDGIYNLEDLVTETRIEDAASCFQANTLLTALHPRILAPVSGYSLSKSDVEFNNENNEGRQYLATRDSHLYAVNKDGVIVDATPKNPDEETREYLRHVVLGPSEKSADLVLNAVSSSSVQTKKKQITAKQQNDSFKAGISLAALGAVITGYGVVSSRRRKRLLNLQQPLTEKAAKLALLSEYKLQNNPDARITRSDFAAINTPVLADVAQINHKAMKRRLKQDRKKETYRYAYSKSDIARAVKIIKYMNRAK